MRLVDADAIKDKLERKIINPQTAFINSILINLLYEAPTAYDVDEVVEKITEVKDTVFLADEILRPEQVCDIIYEIIEIVKKGGVE